MTQRAKKYFIGLLCSIAAMFLWILITVVLTGGRDTHEFTDSDNMIMIAFVVVEIATAIVMIWFALKVGTEQGKRFRNTVYTAGMNQEKKVQRRGMVLLIGAFALAFATMIGGIILGESLSVQMQELCRWLLGISCMSAAVMLLLNIVLKKWYVGRLEKQQVGQVQQFVYSHRDHAEQTAYKKLCFIKKWRLLTALYALLLGFWGLCAALCAGVLYSSGSSVSFCFVAGLLIMCTFSRIRFQPSQKLFEDSKLYVPEDSYPYLHTLAKKAAKTIGCSGKIRIGLLPNCNAGIAKIGQTYSVQLGVILFSVLSEEELYSVLLHEFAHVAENNGGEMEQRGYYAWLHDGKTPHYFSGITNLFFAFFDAVYTLQFGLYDYASSIQAESTADRAMLLCGDPAAVASALLKLKYYELFEWEKGTQDTPCMYEPENPEKQLLTKEVQQFQQEMLHRSGDWKQLVNVEIQSRSASHPTLKQRLEVLGILDPQIITVVSAPDYIKEREQALAYVNGLICEDLAESYEEHRKAYYLEPKALAEAWEEAGRPLVPQEYSDVVGAMRQLGRNTEAIELCERAIQELPIAASCYGYFIRGCYRLHRYDAAGIADVYVAVENNSNYLQEGIETIGRFCCLTGNRKELDIYRQKAVVFAQKHKDQYSQTEVLNKNDRLSEENLPEGMLEDILDHISAVEEGQIQQIYLFRKTITEDFFTSVFVIQFDPEAEDAVCSEIMHKIFQYLDTCSDWQFSLFDYLDVLEVPFSKINNSCVYSKGT